MPLLASTVVVAAIAAAGASASVPAQPSAVSLAIPAPLPASMTLPGLAPSPTKPIRNYSVAAADPAPTPQSEPVAPIEIPTPVIGSLGIPESVLAAYRAAEAAMAEQSPDCGLTWNLLAGIGRIESGHAHGGQVDADGTASPILGPALDGHLAGNTVIHDTDGGDHDGDAVHDRAVGPMQFIPGTWAKYAADGNDDGISDPDNIYDASLAAGRYLCSGGLDLRNPADEGAAVFRYNNSPAYVADVLAWSAAYAVGAQPVTDVSVSAPVAAPPTSEPGAPDILPTSGAPTPPPMPTFALPTLPPLPCLVFCQPAPPA